MTKSNECLSVEATGRRRAGLIFTACCACFGYLLAFDARGQGSAPVTLKGHVTISDLPSGVEQRPAPGLTRAQIVEELSKKPIVVLDNAVLELTPPSAGSSRSLMLNRLELLHGSRIVTNGINLEIDAQSIVSDGGGIIAFVEQRREPAASGNNGAPGLNAGTIVLDTELNHNDLLNIELKGQNGQQGGVGLVGPIGAQGPRGEDGADHLFDCAHGAGNGGNGAKGGVGGTGGVGGPGGSGGKLILRGPITSQRSQIEFTTPGGRGGLGGDGGPGGPGGPPGGGGSGTTYCRGGHPGNPGQLGDKGQPGALGADGVPGAIFAE
jgi:hypothetical protein